MTDADLQVAEALIDRVIQNDRASHAPDVEHASQKSQFSGRSKLSEHSHAHHHDGSQRSRRSKASAARVSERPVSKGTSAHSYVQRETKMRATLDHAR